MLPSNKKMTNICVLEILKEYSDEQHPLTQSEIIKILNDDYNLELERKAIANTLDSLIDFGYDIVKTKTGCYLGEREFEQSEISFLVDAVFSSKSIDSNNSKRLAEKLSKFLSKYNRKKFNYICKADQIVRTNQKQLFYTIDILNEAIAQGKQVEFNYNRFYVKENVRKKNLRYKINPYFMINNQGRYYLVCNLDWFNEIANYKLDLISNIKILDSPVKPITKLKNCENGVDMVEYANENIYMFHNKTINATIKFTDEYAAEYIFEWFGKGANFYTKDNEYFANISANEQALIYWCLQYGESVELISPDDTRTKIADISKKISHTYNG